MTGKEIMEFEHDADLIIKAAIFQQLGLTWPIPYLREWKKDTEKNKAQTHAPALSKSSQQKSLQMVSGISLEMS